MTLANKITLLRIVLIPVFIIGLLEGADPWPLYVFLFCVLTDFLDGFVARMRRQKTTLGTFLDPLADKLLLNAAFLVLAFQDRVPGWVFVTVFSRDLLILLGWNLLFVLTRSSTINPRWLGKSTTAAQMICVAVHLLPVAPPALFAVTGIMAAVTVLSTFDYVWLGGRRLNQLD
jgi:cardiolipin synthase